MHRSGANGALAPAPGPQPLAGCREVDIELLVVLAVVLVHGLLYARGKRPGRGRRLVLALALIALAVPGVILGILFGLSGERSTRWLAYTLIAAPLWLSALSFLVYLPGRRTRARAQ